MRLEWEASKSREFAEAHDGDWILNVWKVGSSGWRWGVQWNKWYAESIGKKGYEPDADKAKAMAEMFMLTWKVGYDAVANALEEREDA